MTENKHKNGDHFSSTLGLEIVELTDNNCEVILPVQDYFYNPINSIHGGVLFTVADVVAGTLSGHLYGKSTTLSSNFNFMAPGMSVKYLIGKSKLIKKGKTIAVIEALIYDDREKLLASGTFTFYNLNISK